MYQWYQYKWYIPRRLCLVQRVCVMIDEAFAWMQSACAVVGPLSLGGYRLVAAVHTGRREGCCSIRALNLEP